MFKVSKASEYAILFLTKLAVLGKKEPVSLKTITQQTGLPYKFLSRIVLKLKKAKIIKTKPGIKGGCLLSQSPNKISLMQIIEAVEPKIWFVSCLNGKCVLEKTCSHKKVWSKLQTILNKEMEKIKLSHLIN